MDKKTLGYNFVNYLKNNYSYARPEIMKSNAFYSLNNDIGMDFLEIFISESNMQKAKKLLFNKFVEVDRKDPQGHVNVHYGCLVKFKEFLDKEYGGAENITIE